MWTCARSPGWGRSLAASYLPAAWSCLVLIDTTTELAAKSRQRSAASAKDASQDEDKDKDKDKDAGGIGDRR